MFRTTLQVKVPIAFGTDAAVYPHGRNAQEFGDTVALGMSPAAALLSSSQGSTRLLGVEAEAGTLEAGKYTDIVGGGSRAACWPTCAVPNIRCW